MLLPHNPSSLKFLRIIGFCALILLMLGLYYSGGTIALAADEEQTVQTPLCRFGVNVDTRNNTSITDFDTAPLRLGWYQNYTTKTSPSRPNGAEHIQVIRLTQDKDDNYSYRPSRSQIEAVIDLNPGVTWFVGNEPDRRALQDDITPPVYAEAYHELYHLIKGRDPSAQVFPGSIVQATEIRLRYLDMILSHYQDKYGMDMPADGWSIHGFILNEVNKENNPNNLPEWGAEIPPGMDDSSGLLIDVQDTDSLDLFRAHVGQFRRWMERNGYRNVPLYMSEYGILMPQGLFEPDFDEGRVNAFMDSTFDYLLTATDPNTGYPADGNRLVQRLSWYSTNDKVNFNGYLFDSDNDDQPTLMGQNYAQYASGVNADLDLFPVNVYVYPHAPLVQDGPADLTIHAQIANSGNELQGTDAVVRFYNGDPDSDGTQIGTAQTVSVGGCGSSVTAQIEWADVTPGVYQVYAEVEPVSGADIQPDNDKASSSFFFATNRLFAPLINFAR